MTVNEIVINGVNVVITLDSIILPNQPIAKEGTLPYRDGNKLKRWEDLKRNIVFSKSGGEEARKCGHINGDTSGLQWNAKLGEWIE
jgi:hypothetical protein